MALLTGGRLQGRIPKETLHKSGEGARRGEGRARRSSVTVFVLRLQVWLSTLRAGKELGFRTRAQRLPTVDGEALESTQEGQAGGQTL